MQSYGRVRKQEDQVALEKYQKYLMSKGLLGSMGNAARKATSEDILAASDMAKQLSGGRDIGGLGGVSRGLLLGLNEKSERDKFLEEEKTRELRRLQLKAAMEQMQSRAYE
jgi:hypothetical protein